MLLLVDDDAASQNFCQVLRYFFTADSRVWKTLFEMAITSPDTLMSLALSGLERSTPSFAHTLYMLEELQTWNVPPSYPPHVLEWLRKVGQELEGNTDFDKFIQGKFVLATSVRH
jgi:hypothetical protein